MLVESTLGAGSGCLSTPQLRFEEEGISFAQGSRAIHFIMNGAPHSRNLGGARELSGTKQQETVPPPWRPEGEGGGRGERETETERDKETETQRQTRRDRDRSRETNWPSFFWGTLTP